MLPVACIQIREALSRVPYLTQIDSQNDYEQALVLMDEMIDDYDENKSLIDILSVSIERWEDQSEEFADFNAAIKKTQGV